MHCVAAGENTGYTTFENKAESTSFVAVATEGSSQPESLLQIKVERVDNLLPADKEYFLFKTDTQGFELGVLKGAESILRGNGVSFLMVEFSYGLLTRAQTDPIELLDFIYDLGFVCTHMAYHTRVRGESGSLKYTVVQHPGAHSSDGFTIPFEEFVQSLQKVELPGTVGVSGWTDLLCWKPWI